MLQKYNSLFDAKRSVEKKISSRNAKNLEVIILGSILPYKSLCMSSMFYSWETTKDSDMSSLKVVSTYFMNGTKFLWRYHIICKKFLTNNG